jgi:hypothetical protein
MKTRHCRYKFDTCSSSLKSSENSTSHPSICILPTKFMIDSIQTISFNLREFIARPWYLVIEWRSFLEYDLHISWYGKRMTQLLAYNMTCKEERRNHLWNWKWLQAVIYWYRRRSCSSKKGNTWPSCQQHMDNMPIAKKCQLTTMWQLNNDDHVNQKL